MYLRTVTRKNKDGSSVKYYQLAHNERDPNTKKPVAHVIHNFGRADRLEREALIRLCKSIARVCGVAVLDADEQQEINAPVGKTGIWLYDKVKFIKTVELGNVMVIKEMWERLGIGKTLREVQKKNGCKVDYEKALLAMVANRLCEPESKLGVWDRWLSRVYLPSCNNLCLRNMYDAMDMLQNASEHVERSIFFHTANLFNLEVDLIFYDTTTASFSIDYEDEMYIGNEKENDYEASEPPLRKYGHSKEGAWSPQVVVALAVTREGLPVRCWVFPGNTSDVDTVKRVRTDLRGWKLGRALFVADSGMNSKENRKELARACGKYLLATRMASVSEVKKDVLSRRGPYKVINDNLHAKEVFVGDGERRRRYVLCYNPKEAERQRKHREEILVKLEAELNKHSDKAATTQWAIELLASRRFKRYLKITKSKKVCLNRKAVRETGRYDGKWVIETNDDSISFEDAACGYKGLLVIERCFRSLKRTQIKMNPMYHWVDRRIESHVRICVLALLIQRVVEMECNSTWSVIRNKLRNLQVTECHTPYHIFFKLNEIEGEVKGTLKKLGITLPKSILGVIDVPKESKK
ncbi:MAG: IS1634 family transposase [Candidatus Pacebacteria bacterium]|nr:IS1634 family transposase [Candidatus Paceibacterota bacterium]